MLIVKLNPSDRCGRNIAALNKTQNKKGTNNEFKNMFRNIELHPQQNTLYKIAS